VISVIKCLLSKVELKMSSKMASKIMILERMK
jgi:hypothetical protein